MGWRLPASTIRGSTRNCCWVRRWGSGGPSWSPLPGPRSLRRRADVRRNGAAAAAARAGRLHPRAQRLSQPRAGGRPPRPRPAARDRAAGRGRAGAPAGSGPRRRHRLRCDRPGGRRRAPASARCSPPTPRPPRSRWRGPTPSASASPSGSSSREGSVPAGERFDLVLANLPYVAERDWASLQPEVTEWEPREALLAGADGLDAYRALFQPRGRALSPIARQSSATLGPDVAGAVAVEVGEGQAEAVAALARGAGFARTETRRDLAGIERVVVAESRDALRQGCRAMSVGRRAGDRRGRQPRGQRGARTNGRRRRRRGLPCRRPLRPRL